MFRRLWRTGQAVVLVGLAVSSSLSLRAQTISGIIAGRVVDQSNAATSASVTATNQDSGKVYTATAGEDGNFRLLEVAPGNYSVKAESLGFQPAQYHGVRVDVGRTTNLDFKLLIPPSQTNITVRDLPSTAPFTEMSGPTLRTDFNRVDIQQIPVLTRDVNNLALLAPGVADVRTYSFGSTLVPFSTNGSRGRDNNFIIDSVSNNEPLLGGAAAQFTNTDIFEEYTVLTNQFKAEFGRNSGATINAITKSGSQGTHGTLFWFGHDQKFNALSQAEHQALLKSPANSYENQGGFTLGGPLSKTNREKALYFVSYQWDGALSNLSSVFPVINTLPTSNGFATLAGLGSSNPALNALLNTPTVYQVPIAFPSPCFSSPPAASPTGQTQNPCFPPTLVPVNNGAQNVEYGAYLVPYGNVFNQHDHQASGRIDYRIRDTDDFYGRYLFDDLKTPRAPLDPAGEAAFGDLGLLSYWKNIYHQRTQSLLLNERHQWTNSLNEFRVSFVRIFQNDGPLNVAPSVSQGQASATVVDAFGGFGAFQGDFPSGGTTFSLGSDTRPGRNASNITEVQENFSYTHGNRNFKFGADLIRTQTNVDTVPQDLGHYFFNSALWLDPQNCASTVGGNLNPGNAGLSDLVNEGNSYCSGTGGMPGTTKTNAGYVFQRFPNVLTDNAGNITGQGPEQLRLREFDQFYFAQVDWRLKPNFTLNLGLRYENYGQPINSIGLENPSAPRVANDNNNFAPRIGFAWSPGDWRKTVFRGGYGIMYDPMVLNIPLLIWQSGPISPLIQSYGLATAAPYNVLTAKSAATPSGTFPNAPFTLADLQKAPPVPGCDQWRPGGNVPLINCSDQVTVDPRLVNPYVQEWSFSLQHSVHPDLLWEIAYVGNKGTKNYMRVDANPFGGYDPNPNFSTINGVNYTCLATPGTLSDECLLPRLNSGKGDIQAITNSGLSSYHALQISVTKRTSRGSWGELEFTSGYTFSHMIDNSSEAFSPAGVPIIGTLSRTSTNIVALQALSGFFAAASQRLVEVATPLPQDSANVAAEKANSSYDRRHRATVSFIYNFPRTSRGGAVGGFFNGWQLNGIGELQSGQPFSPLNGSPIGTCADAFGEGILTNDRPAIGNPAAGSNTVALVDDATCRSIDYKTQTQIAPSKTGYIDLNGNEIDPRTARYVQVPLGVAPGQQFTVPLYTSIGGLVMGQEVFTAGSAGRNSLTGPGTANLDMALYKNFRVGKGDSVKSLQFRWEVYDVLNSANPGYPIGNVFAARAEQTFGFAYGARSTPAAVTGLIPENTIDSVIYPNSVPTHNFLSTQFMNTSSRRMQFGIRYIF